MVIVVDSGGKIQNQIQPSNGNYTSKALMVSQIAFVIACQQPFILVVSMWTMFGVTNQIMFSEYSGIDITLNIMTFWISSLGVWISFSLPLPPPHTHTYTHHTSSLYRSKGYEWCPRRRWISGFPWGKWTEGGPRNSGGAGHQGGHG